MVQRKPLRALRERDERDRRVVDHERAMLGNVNARGEIEARIQAEQRRIEGGKRPQITGDQQRDADGIPAIVRQRARMSRS